MCFSYTASITTFLIGTAGTIYNLIKFRDNPVYTYINIFWFAAILMQLWEALIWKRYKCKLMSKMAMYTNLSQPFWLLILLPHVLKNNEIDTKEVLGIVLLLFFYIYSIKDYFNKDYGCTLTKTGVNLKWWENNYGGNVYFIVVISLLILLIKSKFLMSSQVIYFVVSLITSKIFYKPNQVASVWCFFASLAPIYNYFVFNYMKNKNLQ